MAALSGKRFALCGTAVWLVAIVVEQLRMQVVWPFRNGLPIRRVEFSTAVFIVFATTLWTTLVIAVATRLALNLAIPDRRRTYAIESFFLLTSLLALSWLLLSFFGTPMED